MKFHVLALSILFTLFSFSTLSVECEGQKALASNTAKQTEEDIATLRLINRALKVSFTVPELKSCISNSYKFEKVVRYKEATIKTIDFWKSVLMSQYEELNDINKKYEYYKEECRYIERHCISAEHYRKKYIKEYKKLDETELEIAEEMNNLVDYQNQEKALKKTFDPSCQLQKQFDAKLVKKVCVEHFAFDFPICRDYWEKA